MNVFPSTSLSIVAPAPRHQQLQTAATQFEAVMLRELMKPLANGATIGEDDADTSANPLQSYGTEAMAGALARSGAFGFAKTMVHSIEVREAGTKVQKSRKFHS